METLGEVGPVERFGQVMIRGIPKEGWKLNIGASSPLRHVGL
jgi:hypothetical protein